METLLNHPTVDALGWTLIHFLWQGFLIALILQVVLHVLRPDDAARRYVAASLAMLALVAAPFVTFVAVSHNVGVAVATEVGPIASGGIAPNGVIESELSAAQRPDGDAAHSSQPAVSASEGFIAGLQAKLSAYIPALLPWLVFGWMAGVFVLSLRLAGGWYQTHRLRSSFAEPLPDELQGIFRSLCRRMGIPRTVAAVKSASVAVPMVVGYLKPIVLVPAGAVTELSTSQLEAILAHELAHIKRHDQLLNVIQTIAETILFYHPAVWWVSDRIRVERENCCDDEAVAVSGSLRTYIHALTTLEETRSAPRPLALAAADGSLLARVRRLLDLPTKSTSALGRSWTAGFVCFLMLAIVVAGAAMEPTASQSAHALRSVILGAPYTDGEDGDVIVGREARERHDLDAPEAASKEEIHSFSSGEEDVPDHVSDIDADDDKVVQALIRALEGADADMRAQIAHALGMRESPEAVEALATLLGSDPSEKVRAQAAWALGMIEDEDAVDALVGALENETSSEVRGQAVWALGMIESEESTDALVRLLGREESGDVREQVVWALGMIEDEAAVEGLVPLLRADDESLRRQTIWALGMIESSEAVDALVRAFRSDVSAEEKGQIIWALGMIEDERGLVAVTEALESDDPELRRAAVSALGMMGGPSPNPDPDPNPNPNPNPNPRPAPGGNR